MRKFFVVVAVITLILGCSGKSRGKLRERKSEIAPVTVRVDTVKLHTLKSYIEFTGQPEGIIDFTLSSEVTGKITDIYRKSGDKVKKGDIIAQIDNEDIKLQLQQAKANLEAATQNYNIALKNYKTDKAIYEKNKFISETELETSIGKLKSAEASLKMSQVNYKKALKMLKNSKFVSPENGIINYIYIKKGELVSVGKPVCSIVNPYKLIIKTGISQKDIGDIEVGKKVDLYLDGKHTLQGRITAKGVKPIDRINYPVEMQFDNKDLKILPGMLVKVKILKKEFKDVLSIPQTYIFDEFGRKFVYLAIQNRAVKRFVSVGENISDYYIIKNGVKAGDIIISEGWTNLEDNSLLKIINGSK